MQFRSRVKKSSSKHAGLFSLFSEINTDQPLPLFHNKLLLNIKNYEDENKMLVKQAALCKHEYETLSAKRLELMSEHKIQKIQIKPFFKFLEKFINQNVNKRPIQRKQQRKFIPRRRLFFSTERFFDRKMKHSRNSSKAIQFKVKRQRHSKLLRRRRKPLRPRSDLIKVSQLLFRSSNKSIRKRKRNSCVYSCKRKSKTGVNNKRTQFKAFK